MPQRARIALHPIAKLPQPEAKRQRLGPDRNSKREQEEYKQQQQTQEAKATSISQLNVKDEARDASSEPHSEGSIRGGDKRTVSKTVVSRQQQHHHQHHYRLGGRLRPPLHQPLLLVTSLALALAAERQTPRQARLPPNLPPHLFQRQVQLSLGAQLTALRSQLASGPLELGSPCLGPSTDCSRWIENGHCRMDNLTCACLPQHVALDSTTCLAPALLGYPCRLDGQCQAKVPDSLCGPDRRCACPAHLEAYRKDKCLPASKINDYCLTDRQCQLQDPHSHCKWKIPRIYGLCKCPPNYKAITTSSSAATSSPPETRCAPRLGDACLSSDECLLATPHSECREPAAGDRAAAWRTSGAGSRRCFCAPDRREAPNRMSCEPAPRPLVALSQADTMDAKHQYELVIPAASSPAPPTSTAATPTTTTTEAPRVRVSSLGKPCSSNADCQARDPHSRCLGGRCECLAPSARCSANATGCHADTFQCRNGQCISWYFVCDNFRNCDDGSDEDECRAHLCPPEAFQCGDGGCVARGKQCNGRADCADGSDERDCAGPRAAGGCPPRTFQCASGHCMPGYVLCNAVEDCADGSDEAEALCERARRKWAPPQAARNVTRPPDSQPDSPLLKTDRLAIDKMLQALQLQRRRNPARRRQSRLGTLVQRDDECPRWAFTCRNGKCRSSAILCSAVDGCGDNSDEDRCQVCQCEPPGAKEA